MWDRLSLFWQCVRGPKLYQTYPTVLQADQHVRMQRVLVKVLTYGNLVRSDLRGEYLRIG